MPLQLWPPDSSCKLRLLLWLQLLVLMKLSLAYVCKANPNSKKVRLIQLTNNWNNGFNSKIITIIRFWALTPLDVSGFAKKNSREYIW